MDWSLKMASNQLVKKYFVLFGYLVKLLIKGRFFQNQQSPTN